MPQRHDLDALDQRILQSLQQAPNGLTIHELRLALGLSSTEQTELDRRVRELRAKYVIPCEQRGRSYYYVYRGERDTPIEDAPVDAKTRARILHICGGRCQMCGKTVAEDGIKLHVDHKVPRDWGGSNDDDNLWALCTACNGGKKAFFSSITDERVRSALVHSSVHVRLGELLKAFEGKPVPKAYLEIVAYTHDDWEKRLRELRELGWQYKVTKRLEGVRYRTYFKLTAWREWPENPYAAIKEAEKRKKTKR